MENEFRRKIVCITHDAMLKLAFGGTRYRIKNLPEDAQVIQANYSFEKNAFQLLVISKEFEEVEPGCIAPVFDAVWEALKVFSVEEIACLKERWQERSKDAFDDRPLVAEEKQGGDQFVEWLKKEFK